MKQVTMPTKTFVIVSALIMTVVLIAPLAIFRAVMPKEETERCHLRSIASSLSMYLQTNNYDLPPISFSTTRSSQTDKWIKGNRKEFFELLHLKDAEPDTILFNEMLVPKYWGSKNGAFTMGEKTVEKLNMTYLYCTEHLGEVTCSGKYIRH